LDKQSILKGVKMENVTNNELYTIKEEIDGPKIKVIGVGGGGNNMLNYIAERNIKDVELIAANTDIQALRTSKAHKKIQLGTKLTNGLGAGMKPEIGAKAAEESYEEIKEAINSADLVFIAAGMGGGTGTGAASIIARAAREVGALSIGVVTKPFRFEGSKRAKLAENGINELKKEANSIVVIPNDKILTIIDRKVGRKEAFSLVDDVLYKAVSGIANMVISYGENDINVDFNDLKTVMSYQGLALMGVGEEKGESAAFNAIKKAIESPLLDNISIDGAMGVLVHFTMHENYPLDEIYEGMNIIEEKADNNADIIFGTTTDNSLEPDEIKVTIVATGFEKDANTKKEEVKRNIDVLFNKKEKKVVGGNETNEDDYETPTIFRIMKD
jgi:cell division protein FtsZ